MNYSIFSDTMVDMNWKEIEQKGKDNVPVLFPLGVIEQHGPHLPLGSDIYISYVICKEIKAKLNEQKQDCLIAPPYYWGINHCTGSFPGSFTVKPETMILVLTDIFENLHQFGFKSVYCVNQHGDFLHVRTILDSIKAANEKFHMKIRLVMEPYDLYQYGLSGEEDYILLDKAEYAPELFAVNDEKEKDLLDIHAGAYETAAMKYYYSDIVRNELAEQLTSYSLNESDLNVWLTGGEAVKSVVPLGYAGNPSGYKEKISSINVIYDTLAGYCAQKIMEYQ